LKNNIYSLDFYILDPILGKDSKEKYIKLGDLLEKSKQNAYLLTVDLSNDISLKPLKKNNNEWILENASREFKFSSEEDTTLISLLELDEWGNFIINTHQGSFPLFSYDNNQVVFSNAFLTADIHINAKYYLSNEISDNSSDLRY